MKPLLSGILFILFTLNTVAQYPLTRRLEVRAGQRKPHIERLAHDPQGLLWVGSDLGIQRTDGERTDVVLYTEDHAVTAMANDKDGVLAALSDGTILHCSGARCDTVWQDSTLAGSPVRDLYRDGEGHIWLATYGAGVWVVGDGATRRITMASGLRDDHANALCALSNGSVAVATDQGVAIFKADGSVERTITENDGLPDNLVLSLFPLKDGSLWVGTDREGAVHIILNVDAIEVVVLDKNWGYGPVISIVEHGDLVWTATAMHGVIVVDRTYGSGAYVPVGEVQGAGGRVRQVLPAKGGGVWSCDGTEVIRLHDPDVLVVPEHEDIDLRHITALTSDGSGRIWFASREGIFDHENAFADALIMHRTALSVEEDKPVVTLCPDERGNMWAGSFGNGLFRIAGDGTVKHFTSAEYDVNDHVLAIRSRGDEVWAATLDGLFVWQYTGPADAGSFRHIKLPGSGFVYDVLPLAGGDVLAATDGSGVVRIAKDGSITSMSNKEARTYYSLAIDRAGKAWAVGPGTGACAIGAVSMHCSGSSVAPFDGDLYGMCGYADGLAFLSRNGFSFWDPTTGNAVDLGEEFGLESMDSELNSMIVDRDGAIWLACDKGLVRLRPNQAYLDERVEVRITGFRWGTEELPRIDDMVLRHDQDLLTFQFAALHFAAPGKVRFAYQLEGYDDVPRITRDREVGYSRLPPGNYVFRIQAATDPGALGSGEWMSFPFSIAPPWWRRSWAIALFVLLLTGLLYAFVRMREERLRFRDRMEKDEARFQLEVLRSQVNPHFLFNSFNALIDLIEVDPELAVEHVQDLSDLFRNILQVRDKELIPLKEEMVLLQTYFRLEQKRFGESIGLVVDIAPGCERLFLPPLTLQLLVENAIKHNRATRSEPLMISITARNARVVITNPDRPRNVSVASTGYGLESIRKRYLALKVDPMEVHSADGIFRVSVPLLERKP